MLEKKNRLNKNKDFDNIWKNGRSGFDGFLGIKAMPNSLDINRFGILVGLKISKKAVERNLVKRRLREALRALSPSLKKGFDIVVVSLPAARDKKLEELKKSLEDNFKKIKIWQ